jgi:hypothetical protein
MNRRGFLSFLGGSLVAAPAIVKCASLMPVRGIIMPTEPAWEYGVYKGIIFRGRKDVIHGITAEYIRQNWFEPGPYPVPPTWERLLGDAA